MLKQLGLALGCVALVLGATLTQAAQNVRVRCSCPRTRPS